LKPPITTSTLERLTVTVLADMAALIKDAVAGGGYASSSEVIREAMRDWKVKRALQIQEFASLKADLDKGFTDLAAGRTKEFDLRRVVKRGRKLLASR